MSDIFSNLKQRDNIPVIVSTEEPAEGNLNTVWLRPFKDRKIYLNFPVYLVYRYTGGNDFYNGGIDTSELKEGLAVPSQTSTRILLDLFDDDVDGNFTGDKIPVYLKIFNHTRWALVGIISLEDSVVWCI